MIPPSNEFPQSSRKGAAGLPFRRMLIVVFFRILVFGTAASPWPKVLSLRRGSADVRSQQRMPRSPTTSWAPPARFVGWRIGATIEG